MKFCKNLQRVVDISDPEWAPYWTNYKMLKVSLSNSMVDRCLQNRKEGQKRELLLRAPRVYKYIRGHI